MTSSKILVFPPADLLIAVKNTSDKTISQHVIFHAYSDHILYHHCLGISILWTRGSEHDARNVLKLHPKVQDRVQHGNGGEEGGGAEGDLQVGGENCGDLWG